MNWYRSMYQITGEHPLLKILKLIRGQFTTYRTTEFIIQVKKSTPLSVVWSSEPFTMAYIFEFFRLQSSRVDGNLLRRTSCF